MQEFSSMKLKILCGLKSFGYKYLPWWTKYVWTECSIRTLFCKSVNTVNFN